MLQAYRLQRYEFFPDSQNNFLLSICFLAFCCAGDEVEGGGGEEEAEGCGEEAPEGGLLADGVDAALTYLVPGGDDKHGVVEHVGRHGHPYRTAP